MSLCQELIPLLEMKGEFSFSLSDAPLEKGCFHFCLKHNSCRYSILRFTAVNVLVREQIEVIVKKRIFKWLTDTKDYINFGKYISSKKRLNYIPVITPVTLQTTLTFQKQCTPPKTNKLTRQDEEKTC